MREIMFIIAVLLMIGFTVLPLVKAFGGKISKDSAKRRLVLHIGLFFITLALVVGLTPSIFAADTDVVADSSKGLGYIGAALATGLSALGAGIAVAAAAPAAIGAISENPKNFGKSLIFVALGEGVAIYGLLISILILM